MKNRRYEYILKGRKIVPVSFQEWAKWFEIADNRKLASDNLPGKIRVSTVFLGLDHQLTPGMPPILFETMVFGGRLDQWLWRYMAYDQALTGHRRVVKLVCSLNKLHTLKHSTK